MFWYEEEIKGLERQRLKQTEQPATLFYGSSSIRLWNSLDTDLAAFKPANLGFGGSTLAACSWFFNRVVAPYDAQSIVIYAGDNDLGDGRHPEEVFIFFQQLVHQINDRFGNIPCYYVSIKPSIARWSLKEILKYTNNIIENEIIRHDNNWKFINIYNQMLNKDGYPEKEYFQADGLHLSPKGYALWKQIISARLSESFHTELI
ncbi:GDSL-like Lipase/Acylhydrolase family protein [Mucilaginibacter pineti]|uniref:GDSL-like Lipase/Acylhydrolase family protein n=1 Tax=Mucilaginibacter pineti TaxID=1391627 RepID=A0A1G6URD1_9SPHI|nr:GDSL-type esterase/lipase family protein [Mucilaginibacter pineti]SDD43990.1 GDSL-like Lipase/Acylhydrolase family protein [Mucilaginibacter pineti]